MVKFANENLQICAPTVDFR